MKRISRFVSMILLVAIMLPGIVDASNIVVDKTNILNEEVSSSQELEEQTEAAETEGVYLDLEEKGTEVSEPQTLSIEEEKEEVVTEKDLSEKINLETYSAGNKYIERIKGDNRVETSIQVSKEAYKGEVGTVLLAGYNGQADALTATYIAGQEDAPLLLTYKDRLDLGVEAELKRLNPKRVVILGGQSVVNKKVEDELGSKGYKVIRIEGSNRIETAINVASSNYEYESGLSKATEVFVIEYDSLVDALAIGPVAARDGIPILIIKKDTVPSEVAKFLNERKIKKATIVGGESRISREGENQLRAIVGKVERISGDNRIQTSINISNKYFTNPNSTIIANGHLYTDALIGGYFAAKKNAPIILTNENGINDAALNHIEKAGVKAYVLGGESVISGDMFNTIKDKLDPNSNLPEPEPKPDPEPEPELKPGQRIKYSTTVNLNMRSGIGTNNPILLTIPRGSEVSFISKHGEWSKVKYDNKEGYVSNSYIKMEIVSENEPVEKPEVPKPGQAIVCLDYGHGGSDPGAVLRDSKGKVIRNEKDDTIRIGKLVAADLRRHGVLVDETRAGDEYVSLANRTIFANKKNYNYFVSFHRNSFSSDKAEGVEVWTSKSSHGKSRLLANSIQKGLVSVGFRDRGVKAENFWVLAQTKAPAVLIELGFISNIGDNTIHDKKEKEIVKAIAKSILGELGINYKN